jgi:hypothetical protein
MSADSDRSLCAAAPARLDSERLAVLRLVFALVTVMLALSLTGCSSPSTTSSDPGAQDPSAASAPSPSRQKQAADGAKDAAAAQNGAAQNAQDAIDQTGDE